MKRPLKDRPLLMIMLLAIGFAGLDFALGYPMPVTEATLEESCQTGTWVTGITERAFPVTPRICIHVPPPDPFINLRPPDTRRAAGFVFI